MKGSMAMEVDQNESSFTKSDFISTQPQQANYWGFYATEKYVFPDGVTFIEFKVMNEGDKVKYQKATSRDVVLNRQGDARMKMDTGSERHELIKACAVDWNVVKGEGEIVVFNPLNLQNLLNVLDPKIVEQLELAIRKANPWLLGDMSAADIRKEIENLQEMLKVAEEREAGEASSSNR
jgi:hypothetical protein